MARATFKISSSIKLETRLGGLANPRWSVLLGSIDESGSITAAAKAAGLSYKAAWDAVDAMNNLAGKPVVATAVGGRGGGGAKLTARGTELLATYRLVAEENERFLAGINSKLRHSDLRVLGRLAMRTSARNQWAGKITNIRRGAVNDEVQPTLNRSSVERAIDRLELAESTAIGDALASGTQVLSDAM